MKRTDFLQELRRLPEAKISGKIAESQKKIVLLSQEKLLGNLKNPREISLLKRDIARMKTVLDEKVAAKVAETN